MSADGSKAAQPSPAKIKQWSLSPESGHDFTTFRPKARSSPLQPKEHDHARQCQFLAAHLRTDTLEQRKADRSQGPTSDSWIGIFGKLMYHASYYIQM
jgi:hypothetical protein